MLLPIFVGILTALTVTFFAHYLLIEHDRGGFFESPEGMVDTFRIWVLCYPTIIWPVWKIYDEYLIYISGDFTVGLTIDTALYGLDFLLVIGITFCLGWIAALWNSVNFLFPGPMIGWVVYKHMMNPQSNPFHYFFELNLFIADRIFVHPLPDIIHIPIAFVIGLGLLHSFMIMISNN